MPNPDLKEDLQRIERKVEHLLDYLPYMPVLEPGGGDLITLEDFLENLKRHTYDPEL